MHCKVLILTVWLRDAVLVKDSHIPLAHHWVNPTRSRIVSLAAVFRMWRNAPPKESSFRGALRVIQKTAARETRSRSDMGSNPIWARIFFRVSILLMQKRIMLLYFHERLTWCSKIELIWFYESGTCFSSLATTFPFKVVFQRLLKPLSRNKTRFYEDFEIREVALSLHSSWSSEIAFTTTRGSNIATDQDKTFIIIILQVQFLGTQLAKKKER